MYPRQQSRSFTERPTRDGDTTTTGGGVRIVLRGSTVNAEELTAFHRSDPRFRLSSCALYTVVFDDESVVVGNVEWGNWTVRHLMLVVHGPAIERGDWIPWMAAPGIDVLTVRLVSRKAGVVQWDGSPKPAVITAAQVNLQIIADRVEPNLEKFGQMLRRSGGGTDTVYIELNRRGAYEMIYAALSSKTVRLNKLQRPCRLFLRQTEYTDHERTALAERFGPDFAELGFVERASDVPDRDPNAPRCIPVATLLPKKVLHSVVDYAGEVLPLKNTHPQLREGMLPRPFLTKIFRSRESVEECDVPDRVAWAVLQGGPGFSGVRGTIVPIDGNHLISLRAVWIRGRPEAAVPVLALSHPKNVTILRWTASSVTPSTLREVLDYYPKVQSLVLRIHLVTDSISDICDALNGWMGQSDCRSICLCLTMGTAASPQYFEWSMAQFIWPDSLEELHLRYHTNEDPTIYTEYDPTQIPGPTLDPTPFLRHLALNHPPRLNLLWIDLSLVSLAASTEGIRRFDAVPYAIRIGVRSTQVSDDIDLRGGFRRIVETAAYPETWVVLKNADHYNTVDLSALIDDVILASPDLKLEMEMRNATEAIDQHYRLMNDFITHLFNQVNNIVRVLIRYRRPPPPGAVLPVTGNFQIAPNAHPSRDPLPDPLLFRPS